MIKTDLFRTLFILSFHVLDDFGIDPKNVGLASSAAGKE
jgi:hypothetical protein